MRNAKLANVLGLQAEQAAVDYLVSHGYVVRERRWKPAGGRGEIDIIAQVGSDMVFIEVKMRSSGSREAVNAVDMRKMRNMVIGADAYLSMQQSQGFSYRFDIIAVSGLPDNTKVEHIVDAFLSPLFSCAR